MKKPMNYINALPDFLAMQRISFCWFISQGLNEELALFSRIQDFSQNTEYFMFGNEYNLIKPSYSLLIARKYSGNYRAQLVIPIEVRNKTINSVRYQNQFPIITFPLMTTDATFILNGCERLIVSQIIRSPGVYFEKNKNQKTRNQFKRKLPTDINKLRSFIPSGEAFLSELDLFFPLPTTTYDPIKKRKKIVPYWQNKSIYYYSIKYLNKTENVPSFYFLQCFKLYRAISRTIENDQKIQLIQLFLKWLKLKNNSIYSKNDLTSKNITSLLKYFNFLVKTLIKFFNLLILMIKRW
jgi:DNA-directed RNA polymerase beta subunit